MLKSTFDAGVCFMRMNTKLLIAVLSLCFFSVCVKGEDTKGPTLSVDENKLTISCDGRPDLI